MIAAYKYFLIKHKPKKIFHQFSCPEKYVTKPNAFEFYLGQAQGRSKYKQMCQQFYLFNILRLFELFFLYFLIIRNALKNKFCLPNKVNSVFKHEKYRTSA